MKLQHGNCTYQYRRYLICLLSFISKALLLFKTLFNCVNKRKLILETWSVIIPYKEYTLKFTVIVQVLLSMSQNQ